MRVIISDEAEADLQDIADYIAAAAPQRAESYFEELVASRYSLEDNPNRFSLIDELAYPVIRRRSHGRYLIFYRIGQEDVFIIRVLHSARNYLSILFPDDD